MLYHNSKRKLKNVYRTIDNLLNGDFPINSGKDALKKLRGVLCDAEEKLDKSINIKDEESEKTISRNINLKILQILPIIGFILRSTNIRNAFELLDPLQQIADKVLQGKPQLLLSSEWDYIPFAYPQSLKDLRSFVLIGLPASEAATALLTPITGHELGHAVWRNRGIGPHVLPDLQGKCKDIFNTNENIRDFKKYFPEYNPDDLVNKEIFPVTISEATKLALFQAEEIFCDLFSYAIFGESYLYAFAYILAPTLINPRMAKYPSNKTRIEILVDIAKNEDKILPDAENLGFIDQSSPNLSSSERFIDRMVKEIISYVTPTLWKTIIELIETSEIKRPTQEKSERHFGEFKIGIPSHQPNCLGDIINAGWQYYRELISDTKKSESEKNEELNFLNEVLLKTVEVLEFERRTHQ